MKVLIADDDPTTLLNMTGLLSKTGCEIIEVSSGTAAMAVIQSDSPPDLLFMDWNMPGLTGLEVASLMRETVTDNQPYIVIISSNSASEQVTEALSYGADDFIAKPIDGHLLKAKFAVAKRIINTQRKLRQTNQVLEKLAYYDELTGLLNRRAGTASYQVEKERCLRQETNLAVALVDIDYFKKINDTHGHQAGDKVLKDFASSLQHAVRPYDIVCRYGGEEFMLITEIRDKSDAENLFERIREVIDQKKTVIDGQSIQFTASFGVHVVSPSAQHGLKELLSKADQALYQAKAQGRNQVVVTIDLETTDTRAKIN